MNDKIFDEVVEIISEVLDVSTDSLDEDTAIGDVEQWDSLHHLQIISAIEKHYNIRFTPDIMIDLEDISDIVNAVSNRIQ